MLTSATALGWYLDGARTPRQSGRPAHRRGRGRPGRRHRAGHRQRGGPTDRRGAALRCGRPGGALGPAAAPPGGRGHPDRGRRRRRAAPPPRPAAARRDRSLRRPGGRDGGRVDAGARARPAAAPRAGRGRRGLGRDRPVGRRAAGGAGRRRLAYRCPPSAAHLGAARPPRPGRRLRPPPRPDRQRQPLGRLRAADRGGRGRPTADPRGRGGLPRRAGARHDAGHGLPGRLPGVRDARFRSRRVAPPPPGWRRRLRRPRPAGDQRHRRPDPDRPGLRLEPDRRRREGGGHRAADRARPAGAHRRPGVADGDVRGPPAPRHPPPLSRLRGCCSTSEVGKTHSAGDVSPAKSSEVRG